jgi:hypothetical protein
MSGRLQLEQRRVLRSPRHSNFAGINDSPAWLNGISTFMSQIKVGGNDPSAESDGSLFDGSNVFGWGQGSGASDRFR